MIMSYAGVNGSYWRLAGDSEGRDGVIVRDGGLEGLVAEVETYTAPGAQSTGGRVTGMDVEPMSGTLTYIADPIFVPLGERVGQEPVHTAALYRAWRRAWSLNPHRTGTLYLSPSGGETLTTTVRAASFPGPSDSPDSPDAGWLEGDINVVSDLGLWLAERIGVQPGEVWINSGDLPAWPTVEWSGSGQSLTVPGLSAPIPLPAAGARVCRYDTDPATGGLVTDVATGETVSALWRQMRGARPPRPIEPGEGTSGWSTTSGAQLYVQPRVLDPWAW